MYNVKVGHTFEWVVDSTHDTFDAASDRAMELMDSGYAADRVKVEQS